jgi:hypothetical protein
MPLTGTTRRHPARWTTRLELLLTCPLCETDKVIHSLAYQPRVEPSVASVHALPRREGATADALDCAVWAAPSGW